MLTYNSSLKNDPPVDGSSRNAALMAIRKRSPYGAFGQNHQDVLNALAERQANTLNMESENANAAYASQQQQAQRQLALAGLTQMSEAQQNQNSLSNTRMQNMVGIANGLLGGLFN